jgi:hypothetical protein
VLCDALQFQVPEAGGLGTALLPAVADEHDVAAAGDSGDQVRRCVPVLPP